MFKKEYLLIAFGVIVIILVGIFSGGDKSVIEECEGVVNEEECIEMFHLQEKRDGVNNDQIEAMIPFDKEKESISEKADAIRESMISRARLDPLVESTDIEETFIAWSENMIGTPYKLGGKSKEAIDCSGLFTLFGVEAGIVSPEYMIHVGNAYNMTSRKSIVKEEASRGDVLYFDSLGYGVPNHIAVIERPLYNMLGEQSYDIIDASYTYGVSKRTITIRDGKYNVDGYWYDVSVMSNPLLAFEEERFETIVGEDKVAEEKVVEEVPAKQPVVEQVTTNMYEDDVFYLSYYNAGDVGQNDSTPCQGAGGDICTHLANGGRSIALVEPYRKKYGIEFWDRVVLKGDAACSGVFTVLDEMNKRFRNSCVVGSNSPHCIRGDIAFPAGVKGLGGSCYIDEVIKMD